MTATIEENLARDVSEVKTLLILGRPELALRLINEIKGAGILDLKLVPWLVKTYLKLNDHIAAERTAWQWCEREPKDAETHKALFHAQRKRAPRNAEQAILRAIDIDEDNGELWGLLGALEYKMRGMKHAMVAFGRATETTRKKEKGFYYLSRCLLNEGQLLESAEAITSALDLKQDYADGLFQSGEVLDALEIGDLAMTSYLLSTVKAKAPIDDYIDGLTTAIVKYFHYPQFMIERDEILRADETNPESWFAMGVGYEIGLTEESALVCYKQAVKLNPYHLNSWIRIERISARKKDFAPCMNAYRAIFEIFMKEEIPQPTADIPTELAAA